MIRKETRWGSYIIIDQGPGYVVKRLEIKAGQHISLQYHNYRSEFWTVVRGTGSIKTGNRESQIVRQISPGYQAFIATGTVHQVKADSDLTIIEVWMGQSENLKEEDIERLSYDWNY